MRALPFALLVLLSACRDGCPARTRRVAPVAATAAPAVADASAEGLEAEAAAFEKIAPSTSKPLEGWNEGEQMKRPGFAFDVPADRVDALLDEHQGTLQARAALRRSDSLRTTASAAWTRSRPNRRRAGACTSGGTERVEGPSADCPSTPVAQEAARPSLTTYGEVVARRGVERSSRP